MNDSTIKLIGEINHPQHGKYYIWYNRDSNTYGMSFDAFPTHCGYASLSAMFKVKGF